MNISIIIPCYNEADNIVDAVGMALKYIGDSVFECEIILVDDGSTDNSRTIISGLAETDGRVRAIFHERNLGKGAALQSAFAQARMEWVLMIDADLQIDLVELNYFLPSCHESDLIIGFRRGRRDSAARRIFSKMYALIAYLLLRIKVKDINCPFKLIRRSQLIAINLTSTGFLIDTELICTFIDNGCRIKELPVRFKPRLKGVSSVRLKHVFETIKELFMLRRRRMLHYHSK